MKVRFTPEARLAVREKRAWWELLRSLIEGRTLRFPRNLRKPIPVELPTDGAGSSGTLKWKRMPDHPQHVDTHASEYERESQ